MKLNEILVELIAEDMRPLSIVRDKGFRKYSEALDPRYTLPTTKTLRKKLIPRMFNKTMIDLIEELQSIKHICLTTDGWTSSTADKFQAYTIHYVDWKKDEPSIQSKILECAPFEERCTKVELEKDLRRVTTKYDILEKLSLNVADNASDVQGALKLFGIPQIGCCAHKLNLCAKTVLGIEMVKNLQSKVSAIVRTTKVSANAKKTLNQCQKTFGMKKKALVSFVSTRWNTVYLMFQTALGKFEKFFRSATFKKFEELF